MIIDKHILIPTRPEAEETTLYIKIVAENEQCLTERPYVFMLPGGPGANHSFYKHYECLKDVANIIFYDPRGCGLSAKGSPESYTMDNYIQDLDIIRQQLKLKEIILLGKSYGAICALGYAIRFPGVVTHLIVAAGATSFKHLALAKKHVSLYANEEQKEVCEKLFNGTFKNQIEMDHYLDIMSNYYSYKKRNNLSTTIEMPKAEYPLSFEALNLGFGHFLRYFDYENQLSSIQSKTLVLVGEHDWIMPKKESIKIADCIPDSKLIIFEHSDHSMESDVPELFFAEVRQFIV